MIAPPIGRSQRSRRRPLRPARSGAATPFYPLDRAQVITSMFDIGFSELVLVAIVALVVLGPERLPKAARVAGMWVGRARRTLVSVKQEIDRELRAEELTRILDKQSRLNPLETILEEPQKPTPIAPPTAAAAPPPQDQPPRS
jgi:sec-independent protein translocase protein TatB